MSQSPDLLTAQSSSPENHLNPKVQAALGSLNLQIDEELTRYRRQRRVEQSRSTYPLTGHSQTRQAVDLIYVQAAGSKTQPQTAPETSTLEAVEGTSANPEQPETPDEELTLTSKTAAPDSYLESSEELIKSLSPEQTLKSGKTPKENLLSPLGIGSMLLFLLASITFGYVISNPSSLKHFGFKTTEKTGESNPTAATPPAQEAGKAKEGPLPSAPDLAGQEFVNLDLENLSTLTPQQQNTPSPSAPPTPAANTLSQVTVVPAAPAAISSPAVEGLNDLGSALLENPKPAQTPSRGTPLTPPPQTVSVQPAASPAATQPTATPTTTPSQPDDFFYVVMDYKNDQSLDKARQVVADAYTRDFPSGVQIQLGAFNDAATAKTLVEELQKQGLPAKVYRP